MKTLHFNKGKGFKEHTSIGRFHASRYSGTFRFPPLQSKAETGLWYARASGSPFQVEGEGDTPEAAVEDCRSRALAMAEEIRRIYSPTPNPLKP